MIKFRYENNIVNISKDFIQNHMKNLNGEFVKVYLYAMYASQHGMDLSYESIAEKLGLLESEVKRAFEIFFEIGILSKDEEYTKPKEAAQKPVIKNEELSQFCILAEATYNKPMNEKEMETLYWIYTNLTLQPEVILMAIEYCVAEDKIDMNAVEKVAVKWDKMGITTIPAAQKFLDEIYFKKEFVREYIRDNSIKNINDEQEDFLISWHYDMNVSRELIEFAQKCCENQISKVSFKYMNKIIQNWCKKGITTVEAAKKDNEEFRNKYKGKDEVNSYSGEYDDLAELTQG